MNKKGILLIFVVVLIFCSGWTGKYTLKYDYNKFSERVEFNFDKDIYEIAKEYENIEDGEFFEMDILYSKIYATPKKVYKKNIINDNTTVVLTADYSIDDFYKNEHLFECFENHDFLETTKYYYLNLRGSYKCDIYMIDTFNLDINGFNNVETNADIVNGKIHTWNIKKNDNKIEIYIKRKSYMMMILPYILIIVGIFTGIGFLLYSKSKLANRI